MLYICFAACFVSTLLGAISGIGGGVLIKPILDLCLPLDMPRISFLSSCAVLCMALFSVAQNCVRGDRQALERRVYAPLAVGGTLGGIIGKACFSELSAFVNADSTVKLLQNSLLSVLMLIVFALTPKIRTGDAPARRSVLCGLFIGFMLGAPAAFLGIGGGPLNMLALTAIYRLRHKESALYSLIIIACSQTAGLLTAVLSGVELPYAALIATACASGVLGGIIGRRIARRVSDKSVRALFSAALAAIVLICAVNIARNFITI